MSYHPVPLWRSPLGDAKQQPHLHEDEAPLDTRDETLFDNPQFQHYEETSNIQLFFDLFFVANLTTFTTKHEVNSIGKLSSYIGFFCILWFTWCQVTLYDVRFATDSVIERVAHACHFGVMVGLAVVGPQFDPNAQNWSAFQQLSLILMVSRLVLFAQYGLTMLFVWKYRRTRLPLILVMASLFVAAMLYLGLSFAFSSQRTINAYIGWYVIAVFEVGANIVIAGKWHILSFKETHLVERMTCLTLIVLGEGIIGLTGRIALIENLDYWFTPSVIGSIISAVAIIYLIYQLYFDNVQMEHFGTTRQQIWAFLHFPFHMALVLLVEGVNQFVIYRHLIEDLEAIFNPIINLPADSTNQQVFDLVNQTVYDTLNVFWPKSNETAILTEIFNSLDTLNPSSSANVTDDQLTEASQTFTIELYKLVAENYGFTPPNEISGKNFTDQLQAYVDIFSLIYCYFFITAGIVLIGIAILSWLSMLKENRTWRHYIGIVTNFLLGVGLALLTTMILTDSASNLASSPWALPLLVFVLLIALFLNHVPMSSRTRTKKIQ